MNEKQNAVQVTQETWVSNTSDVDRSVSRLRTILQKEPLKPFVREIATASPPFVAAGAAVAVCPNLFTYAAFVCDLNDVAGYIAAWIIPVSFTEQ